MIGRTGNCPPTCPLVTPLTVRENGIAINMTRITKTSTLWIFEKLVGTTNQAKSSQPGRKSSKRHEIRKDLIKCPKKCFLWKSMALKYHIFLNFILLLVKIYSSVLKIVKTGRETTVKMKNNAYWSKAPFGPKCSLVTGAGDWNFQQVFRSFQNLWNRRPFLCESIAWVRRNTILSWSFTHLIRTSTFAPRNITLIIILEW